MSAVAAPLLELRAISKRFVRRADIAVRLARKLGVKGADATVHALDHVSLAVREREVARMRIAQLNECHV